MRRKLTLKQRTHLLQSGVRTCFENPASKSHQPLSTAEISKTCPWFFDMCDLIAQQPNLVPTGIGNSDTPIDDGVMFGRNKSDDSEVEEGSPPWPDILPNDDLTPDPEPPKKRGWSQVDEEIIASDDDFHPSEPESVEVDEIEVKDKKPPKHTGPSAKGKTPAKPATSKPAPHPTAQKPSKRLV